MGEPTESPKPVARPGRSLESLGLEDLDTPSEPNGALGAEKAGAGAMEPAPGGGAQRLRRKTKAQMPANLNVVDSAFIAVC